MQPLASSSPLSSTLRNASLYRSAYGSPSFDESTLQSPSFGNSSCRCRSQCTPRRLPIKVQSSPSNFDSTWGSNSQLVPRRSPMRVEASPHQSMQSFQNPYQLSEYQPSQTVGCYNSRSPRFQMVKQRTSMTATMAAENRMMTMSMTTEQQVVTMSGFPSSQMSPYQWM